MNVKKRKEEHIEIVLKKNVSYDVKTGFDDVLLIHNSLPELCYDDVDLSTIFLKKKLSFPFIIGAMTGGCQRGWEINKRLAVVAERLSVGFALGSQRAMFVDPSLTKTYDVRGDAPSVPIIGNIGAQQLKEFCTEDILSGMEHLKVDAIAVHLNPLQEIIQKEGEKSTERTLECIRTLKRSTKLPIIVKETGAGISREVGKMLKEASIDYIDVSGAGGTSWSKVEALRGGLPGFEDWGIATVDSIVLNRDNGPLIASGGIRNGIHCAKSISLGASLCSAAFPFIKSLKHAERLLILWREQMRAAAFLVGAKNLEQLKKAKYIIIGKTRERLLAHGCI